jgi:hypothetical protein
MIRCTFFEIILGVGVRVMGLNKPPVFPQLAASK